MAETYLEGTLHRLYQDMLSITAHADNTIDQHNLILRRQLLHCLQNYLLIQSLFTADLVRIREKLEKDITLLESSLREQKSNI